VSEDGVIRNTSPDAVRLIKLIGLDRARAAEFRELWIRIVRLAAKFDPVLQAEPGQFRFINVTPR